MLVKRLISAWLTAVFVTYLFSPQEKILTKDFPLSVNFLLLILGFVSAFILLTFTASLFDNKYKTDSGWLLFITVAITVLLAAGRLDSYSCFAVLPFILAAVYFTLGKDSLRLPAWSKKLWVAVIVIGGLIMLFFAGVLIAARYYGMVAPAFDFGIFTQMFENMKDSFQPITTVERGYELSHFAVHFSPAYYLLLPFYMLCPHPVTLEILQGLAITSGVIPTFLIARKYGLSKPTCAVIGFIFCLYPALVGGCRYDIHENCLLVPLLMWLFWAIEREKFPLIGIFAALTLTVKEDAAVYVSVVALYLLFSDRGKKMKIAGGIMLGGAVLYFLAVCAYLDSQGLGVMSWRYDNYIYDGGGLFSVIKSVLINPAYAVSNLVTEEKILFILQMLLPLGCIPLACKKFSRVILLIPFILINLMTSYVYQYSINFQYVFGSSAIMIWLFIMNGADMKYNTRRVAVAFSALACVAVFGACHWGLTNNLSVFGDDDKAAAISYLESLDTDGSITADTFLVPALYSQKELYSISSSGEPNEKSAPVADVVLLDKRWGRYTEFKNYYLGQGMTEVEVSGAAGNIICRLEKK
ncbi:MAG: DUF2079 domain-containing protein [Eubacterium sp.]|nr:DUF2079 domain-containing protein [Eubacterium sp.]